MDSAVLTNRREEVIFFILIISTCYVLFFITGNKSCKPSLSVLWCLLSCKQPELYIIDKFCKFLCDFCRAAAAM